MGRAALVAWLAVAAGCAQQGPEDCTVDTGAPLAWGNWCERYAAARCERDARCGFSDAGTCACRLTHRDACRSRFGAGTEEQWGFDGASASACLEAMGTASCESGLAEHKHEVARVFQATSPGGRISAEVSAWFNWLPPACGHVLQPVQPPVLGHLCDPPNATRTFSTRRECVEGTCVSQSARTGCGTCVAGGQPQESCFSGATRCARNAFPINEPDGGCLCAAKLADGAICSSDGQCSSDVCGEFSMRCGRVGLGERCGLEDECPPDAFCKGSTAYRTGLALVGDAGTCVARIPSGSACTDEWVDDGCSDPSQVCVAGVCGAPFSLPEGSACTDQDQCASGLRCRGTCVATEMPGSGWLGPAPSVSELICGG